ncbi:hypothetical protein BDV33DRAFT_191989 [Aspergillus novoparasiticus]|uniref:Amino acid/polyamine transporter I n=1 Tax=Aspergillus novoparasiticus TaxID=986946 RepID=A0A5N6ESU9_9EURO|nr:hypothetical protein BDV33DRAFT_191989 [Aspergillus novoparasiticus]
MSHSPPSQVKKHLNGITLLCLAFVICNSWAGIAGSLQLAILAGGPATLVYSIIVAATAYLAIAASLAELAAVYPTAGGQYHIASILAPEQWRQGVSYTCGLLALFSWLVIGVSVTSIAAQQLMALVATSLSDFVPQPWHIFFVYQGLALFAIIYNTFFLKKNPWTHNVACLYWWVPFVVMEQGFRSRTIAIVIVSISIVMAMTIIIATQEASSRLAWALARDKGLLFSQYIEHVHPHLEVPIRSLLLIWVLTFICGFLYLASQTDYTCVILGFCLLLALANWWLHAKDHYNGPVIETWESYEAEPASVSTIISQTKKVNEGTA